MAFQKYVINPGGGYTFEDQFGQFVTASGPDADEMKAQIDSMREAEKQRMLADASEPLASMPEPSASMMPNEPNASMMSDAGPPAAPRASYDAAPSQDVGAMARRELGTVGRYANAVGTGGLAGLAYSAMSSDEPNASSMPEEPISSDPADYERRGGAEGASAAAEADRLRLPAGSVRRAPMYRIPGRDPGYVPTGRQMQTEMGVAETDDERSAREEKEGYQMSQMGFAQAAAEGRAAAEKDAAKRRAEIETAYATRQWDMKLRRDRLRAEHQKRLETMEVDPNRVWEEKGWGAKLAAALAIGLGQYAAIVGGGQNTALQIIDKMVERDIQKQRDALGKAERERDMALMDVDDEREWMATQRVMRLGAIEAELQKKIAETADVELKRDMMGLGAQIAAEKQKDAQYAAERAADRQVLAESEGWDPGQAPSVGGGGIVVDPQAAASLEQQTFEAELARNGGDRDKARAVASAARKEFEKKGTTSSAEMSFLGGTAATKPEGAMDPKEMRDAKRELAREFQKAGIPEALESFGEMEEMLNDAGEDGDIAGVGLGPSALSAVTPGSSGEYLMGEEGRLNRRKVDRFKMRVRRAFTGAGGSDAEMEKLEGMMDKAKTEAELRSATRAMMSALRAQVRNYRAGYGEAYDAYMRDNPRLDPAKEDQRMREASERARKAREARERGVGFGSAGR